METMSHRPVLAGRFTGIRPGSGLRIPRVSPSRVRSRSGSGGRRSFLPALLGAVWVLAACGGGEESLTPTTPAPVPPPAPPPPATPENLSVSGAGTDWIEWSWGRVEGASGYEVQFRIGESPSDADEVIARTSEEVTYRREDLSPGITAHLRVRSVAENAGAVLSSAWSEPVSGNTTLDDRAILEAFYTATGGAGWSHAENWLTDLPLNEWHGVAARDSDGRVTALQLPQNGLEGPLAPELGQLAQLKVLQLFANQLRGPIPSELGQLGSLVTLNLRTNGLNGPIPSELGQLGSLVTLKLNGNELSGPIPVEFGQLTNLTSLYLNWNKLSGPIPLELTALELDVLDLRSSGVCMPDSPRIQDWLDSIESVKVSGVPDCAP